MKLRSPRLARGVAASVLSSALLVSLSIPCWGQQSPGLDDFIERKMIEAHVPGLAASIIKDGKVVWAKGYGFANIELNLRATADTPFSLASISKTVTGTALMQLHDSGGFRLDDDINGYLPFRVENPHFPGVPISFRQVMSHSSSINDNFDVLDHLWHHKQSPYRLSFFISQYLAPGGQWYYPDENYLPVPPGALYSYCDVGFALVGHLVENVARTAFEAYCKQAIFEPLGMEHTGWHISDFDPDTVAMPYHYISQTGRFVPYGHYGYAEWPAGTLRTSVLDLSKFLLVHMNRGSYGGVQILSPAAVAEMHRVQFPALNSEQGLAFYYWHTNNQTFLGHDGGDPGVYTDMWFRPADGVGVILLVNGNAKYDPYYDIFFRLLREADGF
jgi:CubicO group peptidase (beta-lactamase class C family)